VSADRQPLLIQPGASKGADDIFCREPFGEFNRFAVGYLEAPDFASGLRLR
jgi:hypothetical protein